METQSPCPPPSCPPVAKPGALQRESPLPSTGGSSLAPLRLLVIEKWPATRSGQEHGGPGHTSPALLGHGRSWGCRTFPQSSPPHGCHVLSGLEL